MEWQGDEVVVVKQSGQERVDLRDLGKSTRESISHDERGFRVERDGAEVSRTLNARELRGEAKSEGGLTVDGPPIWRMKEGYKEVSNRAALVLVV